MYLYAATEKAGHGESGLGGGGNGGGPAGRQVRSIARDGQTEGGEPVAIAASRRHGELGRGDRVGVKGHRYKASLPHDGVHPAPHAELADEIAGGDDLARVRASAVGKISVVERPGTRAPAPHRPPSGTGMEALRMMPEMSHRPTRSREAVAVAAVAFVEGRVLAGGFVGAVAAEWHKEPVEFRPHRRRAHVHWRNTTFAPVSRFPSHSARNKLKKMPSLFLSSPSSVGRVRSPPPKTIIIIIEIIIL